MEQFIIQGNQKFSGEIEIKGAKNAALPIFFAATAAQDTIVLRNVPTLSDIEVTCEIFNYMGGELERDIANNTVTIKPQTIHKPQVPYELAKKMRASIWALGPLLARFGECRVALPGGCAIGARPVDMHIAALKTLGASIEFEGGDLVAKAPTGLVGAKIFFDKVSVGATVTAVSAAVLAKGETKIENAACEPEVVDLCNFLNSLGAQISGIGTRVLKVVGVEKLAGNLGYSIIPDRIEAATYLVAGVVSRSKVTVKKVNPEHLDSVLEKLKQTGASLEVGEDYITIDMEGKRAKAVSITTQPYPGIPTDVQAQFTLLNTLAEGDSIITETIFENRFMHVPELQRMGANIIQTGNTIHIKGIEKLSGAEVKATDLRASVSLVIAGCIASGETIVDEIYHIDRGYEAIEKQFAALNAIIVRR